MGNVFLLSREARETIRNFKCVVSKRKAKRISVVVFILVF